ncbi:phenylacyl-CoA dehydrogenase [Maricurvus nonylphenolicus]|uniref:acyl-CoA dehydrogenase C-terminal domain-containing protein n=1 Tax=Maricurvus nonylphenolicus TaxID=1008307 RepID=UPI0036F20C0D
MYSYQAPLRDIQFSAFELLGYAEHYASLPGVESIDAEFAEAVMDQTARFAEDVLAPLNAPGDLQGVRWQDGQVFTPDGFKEAYQQYAEGGWVGFSCQPEYGGQGLPKSLNTMIGEMRGAANVAWSMGASLSAGAIDTLMAYGTEEQKQTYLTRLITGDWTATMCLTESHSGTDLGLLRTRAEPNADGSYAITGSKIFISYGEHDMTDNIVHIVLARLPDAPKGTKGISLFIVPKFNVNADGSLGERNGVTCGSIEKKMGLHGSPTCVMNFEGATGYLLGPENRGLNCMFTFMNAMRLGTAAQGVLHSQVALQKSQQYARERLQMRSLSGVKAPESEADPIIVHPDIRRMLLTQKVVAEGGRMFVHYMAQQLDLSEHAADEAQREQSNKLLSFLTPIGKAFLTEMGLEAASLGIQCFGGHGYIHETGVEQNLRDARISTLYEGTTGVQALDLLGRKVLGSGGELLGLFTSQVLEFCKAERSEQFSGQAKQLEQLVKDWLQLTQGIGEKAMQDADEVGAASVDYLMYSGYVIFAYLWLRAAEVAAEAIESKGDADGFYQAKIDTASFFYQRMLPRAMAHKAAAGAGAESLMAIAEEGFCF